MRLFTNKTKRRIHRPECLSRSKTRESVKMLEIRIMRNNCLTICFI